MTPMMQQYFEIKNQYEGYLLFYRLGDFYEMFFDDALTASRELELTLTGRDCGEEERAPMCGVPFHAADGYIAKLVSMGKNGSALFCENGNILRADSVGGKAVNTVGAGDSMVAGFIAGWLESKDYEHAFRMGLATGSASAFSELLATKDEIRTLYETL